MNSRPAEPSCRPATGVHLRALDACTPSIFRDTVHQVQAAGEAILQACNRFAVAARVPGEVMYSLD